MDPASRLRAAMRALLVLSVACVLLWRREAAIARPCVAVRFRSDDFACSDENLRQFVVFRLDRIDLSDS